MNIIIPMAGNGTRAKSTLPKPLIEVVDNKPMIQLALESLDIDGQYCFIIRKYNNNDWNLYLREAINKAVGKAIIVEIDYLTEGPAVSALHAPGLFFDKVELLVTNCDQIMKWDSRKFLNFIKTTDADGAVVTYTTNTPKNSYARIIEDGIFPEFDLIKEKEVISTYSLNGIHWWKTGNKFSQSVLAMMENKDTCNGEYYIGPSYNYLFGKKRVYNIDPSEHFAVGTLEDIQLYRELYDYR